MQKLKAMHKARLWQAPSWLLALVCLVLGLVVGLSVSTWQTVSGAVISLLGVLLGGGIAATANFLATREAHKAQIAAATWPERVRAHQEAYRLAEQMILAIFEDDRNKVIDGRNWYENDCLYLEGTARQEFEMLCDATDEYLLRRQQRSSPDNALRHFDERYKSALKAIVEGAGSHISDEMLERLSSERTRILER